MKWGRNFSYQIQYIVAVLCFLLAALLSAQTAQSPQADPLEQAIKRYIKNSEAADMLRKAVVYLPENPPVRSNYKEQLAQAIERTAIAKRDGVLLDHNLDVTAVLGNALTASWQLNMSNPKILQEMQAINIRIAALSSPDAGLQYTFLWRAIDETAAPVPLSDSHPASQVGSPVPKPDAMFQEAVNTMPEAAYKPQAQRLINRMNPEVQHAVAQIFAEQGRGVHNDPIVLTRGMLIGLASQYSIGSDATIGPVFIDNLAGIIRSTLIFPGAANHLTDALNTMTRLSLHYRDVDWGPYLQQFAKERQSAYMEANLTKMLGETMRFAMSGTPSASAPVSAR